MTVPETNGKRGFVWPADYYSSDSPRAVFPRGLVYGCGGAALLVLILLGVAGIFLSAGGFADLIDFTVGMSLGELRSQITKDVTAGQKTAFEAEVERMRENLRNEKVSVTALQPFLEQMRSVASDRKITPEELTRLQASAHKINAGAKR
jgi:hypothetical protein